MNMQPTRGHDLTVRSVIIRGEKANKGLEAIASNNPNVMNRLIGYLADGTKVLVSQRPGKGGMDFNKLLGGKCYAVAADGFSPVFEKGADKKPTKTQKVEDGLPAYSASGFYLLSSKDYPALENFQAYTRLINDGEQTLLLSDKLLAARQSIELASEIDLDLLDEHLAHMLADERSLVARFDADANKRRERELRRAKEDAEAQDEGWTGATFKELSASHKDGKPFVHFVCKLGKEVISGDILREANLLDDDEGRMRQHYYDPKQAVEHFRTTPAYQRIAAAVDAGQTLTLHLVPGFLMRTSVSFRRKCENVLTAQRENPRKAAYGDAVYILGALAGWTRGLTTLMHSMHPNFPQVDYEAHHYVAALRQAEIGMDKKSDGTGWAAPLALHYDLDAALLSAGRPVKETVRA